ncbi:hypothetical protein PG999_008271 [Apiospora kogelbergensis]|uniref:Uncharacterized protein n=1 Tax=Apiospora kogelbergensis TaxID=1337665 RepID=A0AAW0QFW4_9PEZI
MSKPPTSPSGAPSRSASASPPCPWRRCTPAHPLAPPPARPARQRRQRLDVAPLLLGPRGDAAEEEDEKPAVPRAAASQIHARQQPAGPAPPPPTAARPPEAPPRGVHHAHVERLGPVARRPGAALQPLRPHELDGGGRRRRRRRGRSHSRSSSSRSRSYYHARDRGSSTTELADWVNSSGSGGGGGGGITKTTEVSQSQHRLDSLPRLDAALLSKGPETYHEDLTTTPPPPPPPPVAAAAATDRPPRLSLLLPVPSLAAFIASAGGKHHLRWSLGSSHHRRSRQSATGREGIAAHDKG